MQHFSFKRLAILLTASLILPLLGACILLLAPMAPLTAFAAPPPHGTTRATLVDMSGQKSTPPVVVPYIETDQCLVTHIQGTVTGSNSFTAVTHTYNGCGVTFAITTRLYVYVNCPPNPNATYYRTLTFGNGQTAQISWGPFGAGCVECVNHVPVAYPPFTVNLTAYAYGTINRYVNAVSNYSSATVSLSNNPPTVKPPCP